MTTSTAPTPGPLTPGPVNQQQVEQRLGRILGGWPQDGATAIVRNRVKERNSLPKYGEILECPRREVRITISLVRINGIFQKKVFL